MKVVETKKSKPKSIYFRAIRIGEVFLYRDRGLCLKIRADQAVNFQPGSRGTVFVLPPGELVGVVKAEIRYSEVCESQDEEAEKLLTENLRLAACKRALTELRGIKCTQVVTAGDYWRVPDSLLEMLEEAVGPEWLERNPK